MRHARLLIFSFVVVWILGSLSSCEKISHRLFKEDLPAIPQLNFDSYVPLARDALQQTYQRLLAEPTNAYLNGRVGMLLHAYQQYEPAEIFYLRAHRLEPKNFRWIYYLGLVRAMAGNYEAAAHALEKAVALNPDYVPAKIRLAEALLQLGRLEEAEKLYGRLVSEAPGFPQVYYGLGRVAASRGEHQKAVDMFKKALELFPRYSAAHYSLSLAYRQLGQHEKADQELKIYEADRMTAPPSRDPYELEVQSLNVSHTELIRRAQRLADQGDLQGAIDLHLEALKIKPDVTQAHVNLISLYGRTGQFDKAIEHFKQAIALDPNVAEAYYNYGVVQFEQKNLAEAKKAFQKALQINPRYAEAHNNLGYILLVEGKVHDAEKHFKAALSENPAYRLAHYHLGRILLDRGQVRDAVEHFQQAASLQEDRQTPDFLYVLARAYLAAGNRTAAEETARKALMLAQRYNSQETIRLITQVFPHLAHASTLTPSTSR